MNQNIVDALENFRRAGDLKGCVGLAKRHSSKSLSEIETVMKEFVKRPEGVSYDEHLCSCVSKLKAEPKKRKNFNR